MVTLGMVVQNHLFLVHCCLFLGPRPGQRSKGVQELGFLRSAFVPSSTTRWSWESAPQRPERTLFYGSPGHIIGVAQGSYHIRLYLSGIHLLSSSACLTGIYAIS